MFQKLVGGFLTVVDGSLSEVGNGRTVGRIGFVKRKVPTQVEGARTVRYREIGVFVARDLRGVLRGFVKVVLIVFAPPLNGGTGTVLVTAVDGDEGALVGEPVEALLVRNLVEIECDGRLPFYVVLIGKVERRIRCAGAGTRMS